jgi:outer membrane protein TolC
MTTNLCWRASLLAAQLALGVGAAWAQAPAPDTPAPFSVPSTAARLRDAVEAAWQRALSGAEAQGQLLRAEAARGAAQALLPTAPALELSHRGARPGSSGTRETDVGLALPLWLPGQRSARLALADTDVALAQAHQRWARWQIAAQVREAGWAVAAAQSDARQAHLLHDAARQLADDVARRVHSGDLARSDALAADAEVMAAQAALTEARLKLAEAQRRWTALTGLAPPARESLAEALPAALDEPHPEVRLAEAAVEQARRLGEHTRATRREPPELMLSLRREQDPGSAQRQDTVGVGVRIPLGSAARNLPLEAQAASAQLVAERAVEIARVRTETERSLAQEGLQAARQQLQAHETREALTRERALLFRRAFDAGEMSLPEMLRATAAAGTATTELERARVALDAARARLAQAQGITP